MATKQISWNTGNGNITLTYQGHGNGTIIAESDETNLYEARSAQFTVRTTDGSNIERTITISQAAKERIDISNAVVTASAQTYTGSALTPSVTVTLNGNVIPSSGYDVTYSNNVNAGTATITITGKGDYTGTAVGTFTISRKGLTIKASNQTITYGNSISQGTSYVTVTGLVSGDSLTGITLSQSTSSVTSSGTITPSGAVTSNGASNYSITYQTGTLVINKASGSISLATSAVLAGYDRGQTGTLYVRSSNSGWALTDEKTVSGYNVYRSLSNYHTDSSYSVMKLTFVNNTGSSISTTFKVGPATESSCDYTYIATWDAADISSSSEPSSVIYSGKSVSTTWTDVAITIPTGTHTLQVVYRKDGSVNNSPDCGYIAIPYDVSFTSLMSIGKTYVGSGSFSYSSSNTGVDSVNSSTGAITIQGVGITTIAVNMAADSNYTAASTSYTLTVGAIVPIGCVLNYGYTGSAQSAELPAGQYKLQCWGAQGGTCSSGYSGGKGGYSEGVLTLTSPTTVYIFVGGQGSSSGNGGWNGGGGGSGSSSYSSGSEYGSSTFGCGGGATDIALVTFSMSYSNYRNSRSAASLLSRMIVAGGGSGGAYGYQEVTTTTTSWDSISYSEYAASPWYGKYVRSFLLSGWSVGDELKISISISNDSEIYFQDDNAHDMHLLSQGDNYVTVGSGSSRRYIYIWDTRALANTVPSSLNIYKKVTSTSTDTDSDSKAGYVGGGTNGGGYSSSYYGKQNGAGSNGSFGFGANQTVTNYRYCSGAGGGGWYGGGGGQSSDSSMTTCRYSGGGSGWVNIAANASYRPSGYTGLQLDSGETKAGNTSFPSTSGGTETGHSGNGYARITRLS